LQTDDKYKNIRNKTMKTKQFETLPLDQLPGYTVDPTLDPGQAELTTYIPGQDTPLIVRGDAELIEEGYRRQLVREATAPTVREVPKPVEAPQAPIAVQNQYIDMSALPGREIARMKLRSWFYDRQHKTNMYGLLIDRINEDRDVAFARNLGLLSTTHCAKHEKAVAKLRQLV
jgi:hypothetical protein